VARPCSLGATTMLIAPDAKTLDYVRGRSKIELEPVYPDPDAAYEQVVRIDVSSLQPIGRGSAQPANTRDLMDYLGIEVTQATSARAPAAAWRPACRRRRAARSAHQIRLPAACGPTSRPSWRRPRTKG